MAIQGSRGPTADRLGRLQTTYWVLDGASPPADEPDADKLTHRLVDAYQDALGVAAQSGAELDAVLCAASAQVARELHRTDDVGDRFTPSATVAMLRLGSSVAEWLILGDTDVVWRNGPDAGAATDDRLKTIAEEERARYHRERTRGDTEALRHAHHKLVDAERAARNRPGGYWALTDAALPRGHAVVGSIELSEPWHVVVSTDGLTKLVAGDVEFGALMRDIEARGLRSVAYDLREGASRADDIAAWSIRS